MFELSALSLLAAEPQSFMYLGDRFNTESAALGPISVGAAAVLATVAITLIWLFSKARNRDQSQPTNHPWKLLRELAKAHQLSTSQQRLLHRIIRHYAIDPPARLLLEPERFQAALGDAEFAHEKYGVLRLKERLFTAGSN